MVAQMTEEERLYRAREAGRLAEEPLLAEALETMSRDALQRMLDLPAADHEARYMAACELWVIRGIRDHLKSAIVSGQDMARSRPAVA